MKKLFLIILFFTTIGIFSYEAEASTTSGFIPGQIWYSKDSLVEGDTVNIHTAVWNGEKDSLSTTVEFYDKNVILGDRSIVLSSYELKDVYIPWKITSGDHIISAKITSSTVTVSGKKEKVVLGRIETSDDKKSVSVLTKNNLSDSVSEGLKTQVDKVTSEINNIIPEKVSDSIFDNFNIIDDTREKMSSQVDNIKDKTQKEIDLAKKETKTTEKNIDKKINIEDAVKSPISYIKLFLFSILSFVLNNKIVFYGLLVFLVYYILHFIYLKLRNR